MSSNRCTVGNVIINLLVPCPVCNKEFSAEEIEKHVDRCIFLNSPSESKSTNKRYGANQDKGTLSKRIKPDRDGMKSVLESSVPINQSGTEASKCLEDLNGEVEEGTSTQHRISSSVPLAEQMRPSSLNQFVGQDHVLGQNKALRNLIESKDIPSMILWGPPGCGKTTLAHIIAQQSKTVNNSMRFVKLSATMSGINDVKEVVKVAKNELNSFKRRTILFMDEIHRFNKLQQDTFLPHVESGTITLIGATTENPSFSLNSALLSRCRVIVLQKLDAENLLTILKRALQSIGAVVVKDIDVVSTQDKQSSRLVVEEASVKWLAEMCDGDARIALNSLQMAIQSQEVKKNRSSDGVAKPVLVFLNDIKEGVKKSHLLYDKKGEEHYNIISALHKSIRASNENAALYWLTRMLEGGEDPIFIARRLVRAASEDIGLADAKALPLAVAAMQGCQLLGMPECDVILAECAVYLARAPKSTEVYHALGRAKQCITEHQGPLPSVPLHLRNAPTRLMKDLGYGKGYDPNPHNVPQLTYMPEGMEHLNFFKR